MAEKKSWVLPASASMRSAKLAGFNYTYKNFRLGKMDLSEKMTEKQRLKTLSPEAVLDAFTIGCLREDICRDYILKTLHPDGAQCPACEKCLEDEISIRNFWQLKRCECKQCGRWFSARTATILHNSQLDMRQVFLLCIFCCFSVSTERISELLGISPGTVRIWKMKLFSQNRKKQGINQDEFFEKLQEGKK